MNIYESLHDKTNNLDFRPGLTQTGLFRDRRTLEAWNFGSKKLRGRTIYIAKTKALISWFSHAAAHNLIVELVT